MLADGTPPSAPKLWAAALTDIEVDETVIIILFQFKFMNNFFIFSSIL